MKDPEYPRRNRTETDDFYSQQTGTPILSILFRNNKRAAFENVCQNRRTLIMSHRGSAVKAC